MRVVVDARARQMCDFRVSSLHTFALRGDKVLVAHRSYCMGRRGGMKLARVCSLVAMRAVVDARARQTCNFRVSSLRTFALRKDKLLVRNRSYCMGRRAMMFLTCVRSSVGIRAVVDTRARQTCNFRVSSVHTFAWRGDKLLVGIISYYMGRRPMMSLTCV